MLSSKIIKVLSKLSDGSYSVEIKGVNADNVILGI